MSILADYGEIKYTTNLLEFLSNMTTAVSTTRSPASPYASENMSRKSNVSLFSFQEAPKASAQKPGCSSGHK